jgi:hypothetical protein
MLEGEIMKDPPVPTRLHQGPEKLPPPSRMVIPQPDPNGIDGRRQPKKPRDPLVPSSLATIIGAGACVLALRTHERIDVFAVLFVLWVFAACVALHSWRKRLRSDSPQPPTDPPADTMYPAVELDDLYNEVKPSINPPEPASDTTPLPGFPPDVVKMDQPRKDGRPHSGLPDPMPGSYLERFAITEITTPQGKKHERRRMPTNGHVTQARINQIIAEDRAAAAAQADPTIPPGNPTGIIPGRPGESVGPVTAREVFAGPLTAFGDAVCMLLRWLFSPAYAARMAQVEREIADTEKRIKETVADTVRLRKLVGGPPRPTPPVGARYVYQRLFCPVCDDVKECRVYPDYRVAYCCDYHHWLPGRYPQKPEPNPLEWVKK